MNRINKYILDHLTSDNTGLYVTTVNGMRIVLGSTAMPNSALGDSLPGTVLWAIRSNSRLLMGQSSQGAEVYPVHGDREVIEYLSVLPVMLKQISTYIDTINAAYPHSEMVKGLVKARDDAFQIYKHSGTHNRIDSDSMYALYHKLIRIRQAPFSPSFSHMENLKFLNPHLRIMQEYFSKHSWFKSRREYYEKTLTEHTFRAMHDASHGFTYYTRHNEFVRRKMVDFLNSRTGDDNSCITHHRDDGLSYVPYTQDNLCFLRNSRAYSLQNRMLALGRTVRNENKDRVFNSYFPLVMKRNSDQVFCELNNDNEDNCIRIPRDMFMSVIRSPFMGKYKIKIASSLEYLNRVLPIMARLESKHLGIERWLLWVVFVDNGHDTMHLPPGTPSVALLRMTKRGKRVDVEWHEMYKQYIGSRVAPAKFAEEVFRIHRSCFSLTTRVRDENEPRPFTTHRSYKLTSLPVPYSTSC